VRSAARCGAPIGAGVQSVDMLNSFSRPHPSRLRQTFSLGQVSFGSLSGYAKPHEWHCPQLPHNLRHKPAKLQRQPA
jgi:hypothetical protein